MSQTFGLGALLKKQSKEDRADTLRVWRIALIVTLAIGLAKHIPIAIGLAGLAAAAAPPGHAVAADAAALRVLRRAAGRRC